MRTRLIARLALAGGLLVAGCASPGTAAPATSPGAALTGHAPARPGAAGRASAAANQASRRIRYLGVYESGVPGSYAPVTAFARAVRRRPNIVLYFSSWYEKFQASFARTAYRRGATISVDLDPYHVALSDIVRGRYDGYLRSYADAVRAFGHRVIISFGHEPNGRWYAWGYTRTRPAVWVAAWRHIVTLFRRQGAPNVTWLWIVQQEAAGQGPIRDWWPGRAYVTWTGIDGYYETPGQTFAALFSSTIAAIRRLTDRPIFISETAVGQGAGRAAKIPGLFAGVRARHLLGLLWFDKGQRQGIHHQDWRLEGHPAEVAAFRQALRG